MKTSKQQFNTEWQYTTYTICGKRYRFQGLHSADNVWYVIVCVLDQEGNWSRISFGYMEGSTLVEVSESWTKNFITTI